MKIRNIRLSRVAIAIISFFQKHIFLIFSLVLISLALFVGTKGYSFLKKQNVKPLDLLSFFGSPKENLTSTNDNTNFLLLGIRGQGQDSPNLADTIIIASYNHNSHKISLLSVPRDLWVPSLKSKINAAYYYGQEASPAAGIKMSQAAILEVLGVPIHYTAVVNFSMFQDVINLLDGIEVQNPTAFTDNEFPIPGMENALPISSRYETISFPEGLIAMNGETALKYVRSRHAEGDQGTDFARSQRQQAVIASIRKEIVNASFLLDENKVNQLMDIINKNINTNIPTGLYPSLAKLAVDTKDNPIISIGLSDRPDKDGVTILYNPPSKNYMGEYVLIPKDNNWSALKKYVENRLQGIQ